MHANDIKTPKIEVKEIQTKTILTLKPYIKKAWVDQMNWIEVMQRPDLLERYKDFFQEREYEKTMPAAPKSLQL